MENNSRKTRDLTKTRQSGSLNKGQITLSQGMVKKGDVVAVDKGDDAVRTSVSQNQVTTALCTEHLCIPQDLVYMALSTFQTGKNGVGGENGLST